MTLTRPEVVVAASTLVVDAGAAEVVRALSAEGVETILLKGPSVARALYTHGEVRPYRDADLLVEPDRLEDAGEILARLGYEPIREPLLDAREHHSQAWIRQGGREIDLHRTLPRVGRPPADVWRSLSRRTEPLEVAGVKMRALTKPALALHLALHAVSHGPEVEEPLRDLERAIEQWAIDVWRDARDVAEELDALLAYRAGLTLVAGGERLSDELSLPPELPPELQLITRGPAGSAALYRLVQAPGWSERLTIVRRQIVPPRAYMEHWSPRARSGRAGLAMAHAHRWLVVAARLPRALTAVAAPKLRTRPLARAAPRSAPALAVVGLQRSFGGRHVIRELDMTLERGDRVAFWGANGSGKTTAIRCIAGTLAPSSGAVWVSGQPAGSIAARRLVGVSLAQERSFYMRLSGRKNLLFFARLRCPDEASAVRVVDDLADELELHEILATRADACSAGMLHQLALARALLMDPRLILLDEPTRSLDAAAVERMWAALDRRPSAAIVVATHNVNDVDHCGSRIAFPT